MTTTAEKLAKHAKVNRSTTYVQLESLMKVGLMSTHEEGKKTMFAPESPELLKRLRRYPVAGLLGAPLLVFLGLSLWIFSRREYVLEQ